MHNQQKRIDAKKSLNELIDPCNILIPMSEDGKYGFGHLRFQEHLAAKELISNRSINILPLLNQEWWHGVLLLFAQMNIEGLSWLIKEVGKRGKIEYYQDILAEMIETRPKQERTKLYTILKTYWKSDLDFYDDLLNETPIDDDLNEYDERYYYKMLRRQFHYSG